MTSQPVIILTTTSQAQDAEIVARKLVEGRVAACVQVIERVKSVYWWEGQVRTDSESLLLIKSCEARYPHVEQMIRSIHLENSWYQTPEIIKIPVSGGSEEYLRWLFQSVMDMGGGSEG